MIPIRRAKPLPVAFYNRDPRRVARALLGKLVIRKTPRTILAGRIVETEAYLGTGDAAAHSASGKTARNAVLFGPPGLAYVYFIYGNYYCLNVSCLPDGVAGGVLFRALEPLAGVKEMAAARGLEVMGADDLKNVNWLRKISSGPGRLCEALDVTRERDNGKNLMSARSDLQIVDDGYRVRRVLVGPRIGITKSAAEQLRYVIADNPFVSVPMPKPISKPKSEPVSRSKSAPVKA
ncbi:MAG: DNA-3-methyladenine glycosylase [Terriglobales bacterium]